MRRRLLRSPSVRILGHSTAGERPAMTQRELKPSSEAADTSLDDSTAAWPVALEQYDRAADKLNLGSAVREVLRNPKREVTVHFPVQLDDGSTRVFTGYRVWHNVTRGPAKGGAPLSRNHPGPGAVRRPTRRYTTEIADMLGPDSDIPAPDVNTNAQVMAWVMDTYSMHRGYSVPGVVTGKPLSIGGSEGRNEATGRGVVYTAQEAAKAIGLEIDGARVAVQGYGTVGESVARFIAEVGAKVVA